MLLKMVQARRSRDVFVQVLSFEMKLTVCSPCKDGLQSLYACFAVIVRKLCSHSKHDLQSL